MKSIKKKKMYCVADSTESDFWGPYLNPNLATRVLKFVRQAVDADARIVDVECDLHELEIMAGLMPIRVCVEFRNGSPMEPKVDVCWPPYEQEGILINQETYREYFVWAKGRTEAIIKITKFKVPEPDRTTCEGTALAG